MQPYFFPYIGYWQLLNYVDLWVIFDDIQYIRHGWINRNRILHFDKNKEFNYINLPLEKSSFKKINEIHLCEKLEIVKERIISQLTVYKYKKAPNYKVTVDLVKSCLNVNSNKLSDILANTIYQLSTHLKINTKIISQSSLQMDPIIKDPGDWALEISKFLNAKEYINPEGGFNLFEKYKFTDLNIKLKFLRTVDIKYNQGNNEFIPNLSIIDLLMWNKTEDLPFFLNSFEIFE